MWLHLYFYIYFYHPTKLRCDGVGEGRGVMVTGARSPSIMDRMVSGMLVASLHWSCQLLSFSDSMSLACPAGMITS